MEHFYPISYIREIIIILVAVGVVVPLFRRLGINSVLGYLLAGFIVGPYGLGSLPFSYLKNITINNLDQVRHIAEFGIVFLLFMIGLELSPRRLWDMRTQVFGLGLLQVVLTALIIAPVAFAFGNSLSASIVLGAGFALSSTAIVMQILIERGKMATQLGRTSFSILLFQDLAVVPVLILLGIIGAGAAQDIGAAILIALVKSIAVVILIGFIGYFMLRPLFRIAGSSSSTEPFMAVTLLVILVTATATGYAGLSMALGAFLAGLMLAETEYQHSIEVYIEPFKGIFLGVFFMTVGMGLDPSQVMENLFWLGAAVVGLVLLKAMVIAPLARLFGLTWGVAIETGLLLGQSGEFCFVIVGAAMLSKILPQDVGQFMLIVTTLSMVATPGVYYLARKMRIYLEKRASGISVARQADIPDMSGHVIIAGAGRVGRSVARVLEAEKIPYIMIDSDTSVVEGRRKESQEIFYGDVSRYEFLKIFHLESAAALVLSMDDARAASKTISLALKYWRGLPIFARARDMRVARVLHKAGATNVVAETHEASLKLTQHLLNGLGVEQDVIFRRLEAERDRARNGLVRD